MEAGDKVYAKIIVKIIIICIFFSLCTLEVSATVLNYTISQMDVLRGSRGFGYNVEIVLGSYNGQATIIFDEGKNTQTKYDLNFVDGSISREYEYPYTFDDMSNITFSLMIGSKSVIDKLVLGKAVVTGSVSVPEDLAITSNAMANAGHIDLAEIAERTSDDGISSSSNVLEHTSVALDKSGQSSQVILKFYIILFVLIGGSVLLIPKRK